MDQVPILTIIGILFIVGLIVGVLIVLSREHTIQTKEEELKLEQVRKTIETVNINYKNAINIIEIPENAKKVKYKNKSSKSQMGLFKGELFVWNNLTELCFFPCEPTIDRVRYFIGKEISASRLPFSKIEYFSSQGELIRENKISGGGGGGSSIAGAIVGAVIAGAPGAIIGSRKGVKEVSSELVTQDTREAYLNYFNDENERCSLFFNIQDYQTFNDLIPEKEYSVVNAIKTNKIIKRTQEDNSSKRIMDQIRELGNLEKEGLITREEFEQKKKFLLEKIK